MFQVMNGHCFIGFTTSGTHSASSSSCRVRQQATLADILNTSSAKCSHNCCSCSGSVSSCSSSDTGSNCNGFDNMESCDICNSDNEKKCCSLLCGERSTGNSQTINGVGHSASLHQQKISSLALQNKCGPQYGQLTDKFLTSYNITTRDAHTASHGKNARRSTRLSGGATASLPPPVIDLTEPSSSTSEELVHPKLSHSSPTVRQLFTPSPPADEATAKDRLSFAGFDEPETTEGVSSSSSQEVATGRLGTPPPLNTTGTVL